MTLIGTGSPFGPFDGGESFSPVVCESLEPIGGYKINELDELGTILLSPEELEDLIHQRAWDAESSGTSSYDQAVFGLVQGLLYKPNKHDEVDYDTYFEPFSIGGRVNLDTIWKLVDCFDIPVFDIDKFGLPVFEESTTH